MVVRRSSQAGFTMVETVAGLAVLLVLVALLTVFVSPVLIGLPAFSEKNRQNAEIVQLQNLLFKISGEIAIPYWWPPEAIEVTDAQVLIHDLSKQNTSAETTQPDILELQFKDEVLTVNWNQQIYRFELSATVLFKPWANDSQQFIGVELSIQDGPSLILPFMALPLTVGDKP